MKSVLLQAVEALPQQIMNLPKGRWSKGTLHTNDYLIGHRDARHAATELIIAAIAALEAAIGERGEPAPALPPRTVECPFCERWMIAGSECSNADRAAVCDVRNPGSPPLPLKDEGEALHLTDEQRSDLRVGAMVFRVPPYHKNPQSQRIADLMESLSAKDKP